MGRSDKFGSQTKFRRMKEIASQYSIALSIVNLKTFRFTLGENGTLPGPSYRDLKHFVVKVDNVLDTLNPLDNMFVKKEFFEQEDKYWWIGSYSKTTYYRLRGIAIDCFLKAWDKSNQ